MNLKSLKDRLRARHNVAVAEINHQDLSQRGLAAPLLWVAIRQLRRTRFAPSRTRQHQFLGAYLSDRPSNGWHRTRESCALLPCIGVLSLELAEGQTSGSQEPQGPSACPP